MILMIDNYDSFTYNLVQYIRSLKFDVSVIYNDQLLLEDIERLQPEVICLSPGPGRPVDAGVTLETIKKFAGEVPILGICLGHQAIIEAFGGQIVKAKFPMHGKQEEIFHDGETIYHHLPNPLKVARYHSLIAEPKSMPRELNISAMTSTGEVMSVRHETLPIEGMQFHPESVFTEHGMTLLKQFFETYHVLPSKRKLTL